MNIGEGRETRNNVKKMEKALEMMWRAWELMLEYPLSEHRRDLDAQIEHSLYYIAGAKRVGTVEDKEKASE